MNSPEVESSRKGRLLAACSNSNELKCYCRAKLQLLVACAAAAAVNEPVGELAESPFLLVATADGNEAERQHRQRA
jgi:hypothetical protein